MNIKNLCGYVVAAFLFIQSTYAAPIENSLCGSAGYAMGILMVWQTLQWMHKLL